MAKEKKKKKTGIIQIPNVKINRYDNTVLMITHIIDYYKNNNHGESEFNFTISRINKTDYDAIRSYILHEYELLFAIEELEFYSCKNVFNACIYKITI